jgi:hypothetical protein
MTFPFPRMSGQGYDWSGDGVSFDARNALTSRARCDDSIQPAEGILFSFSKKEFQSENKNGKQSLRELTCADGGLYGSWL